MNSKRMTVPKVSPYKESTTKLQVAKPRNSVTFAPSIPLDTKIEQEQTFSRLSIQPTQIPQRKLVNSRTNMKTYIAKTNLPFSITPAPKKSLVGLAVKKTRTNTT